MPARADSFFPRARTRDARFTLIDFSCDASFASSHARASQVLFIDDAFVFVLARGVRAKPSGVGSALASKRRGWSAKERIKSSVFAFRGRALAGEGERWRRRNSERAARGGGAASDGVERVMTVEVLFDDLLGMDYGNHLILNGRLALEARKAKVRTFAHASEALRFHGAELRRRRGDFAQTERSEREEMYGEYDERAFGFRKRHRSSASFGKRTREDESTDGGALSPRLNGGDGEGGASSSASDAEDERRDGEREEDDFQGSAPRNNIVEPMRVIELRDKTFVATFTDVHLQPALQAVVEPHERLLRLFETGLPLWAIMCPQYGVPYRPIFRRAIKALSFALIILSCVSGLMELQRSMPSVAPNWARPQHPNVRAGLFAGNVYAQSLIIAPLYNKLRVFVTSGVGVVISAGERAARAAVAFTASRTSASALAIWRLLARTTRGLLSLLLYIIDRAIAHRKSLFLRIAAKAGMAPPRPKFVSPMRNRKAYDRDVISRIEREQDVNEIEAEYDDEQYDEDESFDAGSVVKKLN